MNFTKEQLEKMMEENNGNLDLSGTQITSLPDNLTVGGWLDLSGTQITALPDNLTVGGSLDLSGTQIRNKTKAEQNVKRFKNGDYVPGRYLYADGILMHVKRCRKYGQYTYYVGKIKGKNVVFDGENYAHCKSFKEGVVDLEFKKAKDRGSEQYSSLTLDSEVTKDEAITMYRIITGACRAGTEGFLSTIKRFKAKYTVRELIEITRGQYGAETFKQFFERR